MPYPDSIGLDHRIVSIAVTSDFIRLDAIMPSWLIDEITNFDIPLLDGYLYSVDNPIEITHASQSGGLDDRAGVAAETYNVLAKCPFPYLNFYKKTFIRGASGNSAVVVLRLIYGPYRIPG